MPKSNNAQKDEVADAKWKLSNHFLYRKPIEMFEKHLDNPKALASSLLPKRPIEKLETLAKKNDQQAMLELEDWKQFGLCSKSDMGDYRELTVNESLFYPEAATTDAILWYGMFWRIGIRTDKISVFKEIPREVKTDELLITCYKNVYKSIEKSAQRGYISAFALIRAQEALQNRLWIPSAIILDALDKFYKKHGALKAYAFLSGIQREDVHCSNSRCKNKVQETSVRECQLCCRKSYCSLKCQINHWHFEHRRECQHHLKLTQVPVGAGPSLSSHLFDLFKDDPKALLVKQADVDMFKTLHFTDSALNMKATAKTVQKLIEQSFKVSNLDALDINSQRKYAFYRCFLLEAELCLSTKAKNAMEPFAKIVDTCSELLALDIIRFEDQDLVRKLRDNLAGFAVMVTSLMNIDSAIQAATNLEDRRRSPQRRGKNKRKERSTSSEKLRLDEKQVTAVSCRQLVKNQLALNSKSETDSCPICITEWIQFSEESIAIVAPCDHAICAPCLSRYRSECKVSFETDIGEHNTKFTCTICREKLNSDVLYQAAKDLLSRNAIESISVLAEHLPLRKPDAEHLICNIIVQNHFDINRVESSLFNIVCLSTASEKSELDTKDKQAIYRTARQPVLKLEEDYNRLSEKLAKMTSTESRKYRETVTKMERVSQMLRSARMNAMRDIFEQMNSVGEMGSTNESDSLRLDLHGLHVDEAKSILQEFVFPILPAMKRIFLITGRGNHSDAGFSVLKESLRKYIKQESEAGPLRIKCEQFKNNPGVLCISS